MEKRPGKKESKTTVRTYTISSTDSEQDNHDNSLKWRPIYDGEALGKIYDDIETTEGKVFFWIISIVILAILCLIML